MSTLISIIVPVYNVSRFLPRCIDSLLAQTYRDLEIILVDDGSTDGSSEICDEYSEKDDRIRVIHKENGGHTSALNEGLKVFKGDELALIDSDDYVEPEYIETLHCTMHEQNVDVVICDFEYVDEDGHFLYPSKQRMPAGKCSADELLYSYVLFNKDLFYMTVLWNKLYKRELVGEFRFPCTSRYFEDSYWCPNYFSHCKNGYVIDNVLCHYTLNMNSLTHAKPTREKMDAYRNIFIWKRKYLVENTDIKEAKLIALFRERNIQHEHFGSDKEWKKEIQRTYRSVYLNGKYKMDISLSRRLKFFAAFVSIDLYLLLGESIKRMKVHR